ncbi:hypothetical protein G3I18_24980 [Actinospica acidiphila]|uniref:Uncharacterized protein n=1 Tax=Actinospica acidiphila TaxID=304899 RepID=A0A9X5CNM4_9ACTN|nr:hypothetical protein [Actinospica acidiphila]NEC51791.1 hypothetical protein [Actinospica acidiphila]
MQVTSAASLLENRTVCHVTQAPALWQLPTSPARMISVRCVPDTPSCDVVAVERTVSRRSDGVTGV